MYYPREIVDMLEILFVASYKATNCVPNIVKKELYFLPKVLYFLCLMEKSMFNDPFYSKVVIKPDNDLHF